MATGKVKSGAYVGQRLSKSVAGNTDVTLTAAESQSTYFEFTGALTGDINVLIPFEDGQYFVVNNLTTGNQKLTVKGSTGTGFSVPGNGTNGKAIGYWDGTNGIPVFVEVTGVEFVPADSANAPPAAAWVNGAIRQVPTAPRTLTTETAANIDAAFPHLGVGDQFDTVVHNNSGGANAITIAAGAGVTFFPTTPSTIAQNKTMFMRWKKTAAGAYNVYFLAGA